ncbi:MAG: glycosyltransferase, partial [Gammaproteobacteria bacterium]
TRVFEAAGAAACLVCDVWDGIEQFLEPGREVLCVGSGEEVVSLMDATDAATARRIGEAARARVLAEHTYAHRAAQLFSLLVQQRVAQHPFAVRSSEASRRASLDRP